MEDPVIHRQDHFMSLRDVVSEHTLFVNVAFASVPHHSHRGVCWFARRKPQTGFMFLWRVDEQSVWPSGDEQASNRLNCVTRFFSFFFFVELTFGLVHMSARLTVRMRPRCLTTFSNTNKSHHYGRAAQFVDAVCERS